MCICIFNIKKYFEPYGLFNSGRTQFMLKNEERVPCIKVLDIRYSPQIQNCFLVCGDIANLTEASKTTDRF